MKTIPLRAAGGCDEEPSGDPGAWGADFRTHAALFLDHIARQMAAARDLRDCRR